jgi:hypothetical protein
MKKLLFGGFVFAFGFFLAVFLIGIPAHVRAGAAISTTQNGDVNGDGQLDISDAVYLLLHMFKSGPAPVACADTPELVARVEALEAKDASLQDESSRLRRDLATSRDELTQFSEKTALFCKGLSASAHFPCASGSTQPPVSGPGYFQVTVPSSVIRYGELIDAVSVPGSNDLQARAIRFTTNRQADLMFEAAGNGGTQGIQLVLDDGLDEVAFANPNVWPSPPHTTLAVPAGDHTLTVFGSCECPVNGTSCSPNTGFGSLIVRYLD